MPPSLAELVTPHHTAVLVMEMQNGVVGATHLGGLADAVARHGTVAQVARVLAAARGAGMRAFYLCAGRRPDSAGASANCRLLALGRKSDTPMTPGSEAHAVVPALAPQDADFVLTRFHGVTPFHGSELDALLRNLGVRTVVATGVSANIGIPGLTMEAVNAGYQVVIPRDAVCGTPDEYVDAVFRYTLHMLATVTTVDELVAAWG